MKIAVGSDRRGFKYKELVLAYLNKQGYVTLDVGPFDDSLPVDYPIYGEGVGRAVVSGRCDRGVVICATGIGIMIAANKVDGVRCGIAYTDEVAALMRQHNDANVIAFGQDYMSYKDVVKRLDIFLSTPFSKSYHIPRIEQIANIENGIPLEQSKFINF